MATQTLEFSAGTGLAISCKLFAIGTDTVVDTQTATEKTNAKGRYSVAFTDLAAGSYQLIGFVSGVGGFVNEIYDTLSATGTYYPRSEERMRGTDGAYTGTPPTVAAIASETWNRLPSESWTDGSFGDRILIGANNNRSILVTGSNHAAADIHELQNGVIAGIHFDGSTAFPLTSIDTGATRIARTGADGDTLETLSDQIDGIESTALTGPYTVTLTVEDSAGDPIEGATVRLYRTGYTQTQETDVDGEVIYTVDGATWSYSVIANGYTGETGTIVVTASTSQTITLDDASAGSGVPGGWSST